MVFKQLSSSFCFQSSSSKAAEAQVSPAASANRRRFSAFSFQNLDDIIKKV